MLHPDDPDFDDVMADRRRNNAARRAWRASWVDGTTAEPPDGPDEPDPDDDEDFDEDAWDHADAASGHIGLREDAQ